MPVNPISEMAEKLERFRAASVALAMSQAGKLEGEAKQSAPWHDRTANARQGLHGGIEPGSGKTIVRIYLAHSVVYGVFLESGNKAHTIVPKTKKALFWHGAAHPVRKVFKPARKPIFAVIRPTVERNLGEMGQQYLELLR